MLSRPKQRGGLRRLIAMTFAVVVLMSLAPLSPAYGQVSGASPASAEPGLVSQVTGWLTRTVTDLFTEDPKGEVRPGTGAFQLPGREGKEPQRRTAPPGKRVKELTDKRSARGSMWQLDDGRTEVELSPVPVHYQDKSGKWQKLDTTVVPVSGEEGFPLGNDTSGFTARFGDRSDQLAKISIGSASITLGLPGEPRPVTPQVSGSAVTFPALFGEGADLMYKLTPTGVKEFVVLAKAPAAGAKFELTVKAEGISGRQNADGTIEYVDGDGVRVLSVPKPFMVDSGKDPASPYGRPYSTAVTQAFTPGEGGQATISLVPDAAWLSAKERVFPAYIDPTIVLRPVGAIAGWDAYLDSSARTTNFSDSWRLPVGKTASGATNRSLINIQAVDMLPDEGVVSVDNAQLKVYFDQALGESGPVAVGVHEVTGDWSESDVTWANQPAFKATAASTVTRSPGEGSRWHAFDVTSIVNGWLGQEFWTNGFLLKATDETTAAKVGGPVYTSGDDLYGGDGMTGEEVVWPSLVVTYGKPAVTLQQPTSATSVGASLTWTAYADPTPSDPSDDLVEYRVRRWCPTGCQSNPTNRSYDDLVTALPPDQTSFVDTSSGGDPQAVADPSYTHEATYRVEAVLKNGEVSPSQEMRVILPRPGQVTRVLTGSMDTTLSSGEPSTGHDVVSGKKWLQVGNTTTAPLATTRATVKFDDFTDQIPADAQVTEAALSLWGTTSTGTGATFTAHKLTKAFDESATWASPWTTAGGDFDPAVLSTVSGVTAGPGWKRWSVTEAAKAWIAGPALNHGLLVKVGNEAATAKQSASFLASEGEEPQLRPRLRVTYYEKTAGSSAYYAPATPERLDVGATTTLPVVVTNTTSETWTASRTALSYRWKLPDGTDISTPANQARTMLPTDLAPGESAYVDATVNAPTLNGTSTNLAEGAQLVWDTQDTVTNNWKSATHHLPELPQQIRLDSPTSDLLGLEKFYSYTGKNTGAGTTAMVNPYAGNAVWGYNAFSNPSRGAQTFARMTYNSLDTSTSSLGYGWSLQTSTLQRLGSQVQFHPPGQNWPTQVRLTDGDGTTHVWTLPEGVDPKTCNPSTCAYKNPRGVHLYLQRVARADDPTRYSLDPLRQWVFTKPDRTQFFFDEEGFQSAIVDKNGNTMSFTYARRHSNNKPTKFLQYITDAAGRQTLKLDYYSKGQDYTYINDAGIEVADTKLTNPHIIDNIESITDIAGRKVTFAYSDKGLMAKMVDGAGDDEAKTFGFTYDATQGTKNVKLVSVKDPRGNSTDLTYYAAPVDPKDKWKVETLTDRLDGVTRFDYVDPDGPQGGKIHATVTDPLTNATKYVLDAYGRPESITNAKNETTSLTWDPDHNVVKLTEANQAYATWVFDQKTGFPLELKDAEANANSTAPTTLAYQSFLNGYVADLTGKTSPEGRKWAFGYDAKGNLKTVTDPLGVASPTAGDYTTGYDYDPLGQLIKSTDANGNPTTFSDYHPSGYPEKITDAYSNVTSSVYDVRGNVLNVTDALGKKVTQTYDLFKRPLESKVPKDQDASPPAYITTPAPVYDRNDNITKATAPNGATSTATYDPADQLIASVLPKDDDTGQERKATLTYDAAGNLRAQTEPKGNLTPTDPTDFVTTYVYDVVYQLTDVLNAQQHKITYSYDNVGNATKVVDPRKNATADANDFTATYVYDFNHRVTSAKDAAGYETNTKVDLDGLVTEQTDQEGNTSFTVYDGRGAVKETKVPHAETDGVIKYVVAQFAYDQVGNKTKSITPRGVETTNDPTDFISETKYDKLNRPIEEIYPFDRDDPTYNTPDSVKYAYDDVSRLKEISAPPSHGQTVRNITTMSYWDNGWSKTTTDPWDIKTTYDYNDLGAQTNRTVTSAGGSSQRALDWTYYPDGKTKTHSDNGAPLGLDVVLGDNSDTGQTTATGSWTLTSGAVGGSNIVGPQAVVVATSGFVGYDYAVANPGTGTSAFTWNLTTPAPGTYKVAVHYPSGATATNAKYTVNHDGGSDVAVLDQTTNSGEWVVLGEYSFTAGNSHSVTLTDEANGTVVADAVKLVRDTAGQADTEKTDFTYTYDPNANLTLIQDASPTAKINRWEIGYTGLNQIDTLIERVGGPTGTIKNTTTYAYNENSAVTRRTHDKTLATYGYDIRDLVNQVVNKKSASDPTPKTSSYTYTPRAERLKETKANNNTVDYDYFLSGVLRHSLEKKPNGTVVAEHTIGYQGNLQRASDHAKIQNADNPGAYLDNTYAYTYDPRDRIAKTVKTPTGGGATDTETYWHDANSNVYEETVLGKKTTFTYDRNRLMTSATDGAASTYVYDPYGRLKQITAAGKALEKYTYDGFDHVTKHEKLGGDGATTVTSYTYDPLDRTTTKTEKEGSASAKTTTYSYLGLSGEVLDEEVAGQLTKSFQYSPWGERLSQTKITVTGAEESSYYGRNPHTDVEQITGENGDTRATYGYTAYGSNDDKLFTGVDKPDPVDPTAKEEYNPYRFNSKRWDNSTGMYDMGFRDYNPSLNRFITQDSYNGALSDLSLGLDPWTANRYAFTGGNPIGGVEIDGHEPRPWHNPDYKASDCYDNASLECNPGAMGKKMIASHMDPRYREGMDENGDGTVDAFEAARHGESLDEDGARNGRPPGKGELEALSYFPVIGTPADIALAVTKLTAGDAEGAVWDLVGMVPLAGDTGKFIGRLVRRCNSFTPDTEVLMADGTSKPIAEVEVGDEVLATDPETGKTEPKPVVGVITGEGDKNLVQITIDGKDQERGSEAGGIIVATAQHPFWVPRQERWIDATDLQPGTWLRTSAGTYVQVTAIKRWSAHQRVHNLTIADTHTYYVVAGTTSVLVHNSGCGDPREVAQAYRADPRNGVGARRNVAVAQYDIEGLRGQLIGVSGKHQNPGSVAMPDSPIFQPGDRSSDSEWLILEHLAKTLNSGSKGTINLYSEREVCPSCQSVIGQFKQKFPGIRINVTTG